MLPRVIWDFGLLRIHTFGLTVAAGIIIGSYLTLILARKAKIESDIILNTVLYGSIAGVVGARLVFVLLNLSWYLANPGDVFLIQAGGLSLHGGLLGGLLVVIYQSMKKRVGFWRLLDLLAPGTALAIAIGRIGCDLVGVPTELPWGIIYEGVRVHPIQIYSFLFNLTLFFYLWQKSKDNLNRGAIFLRFTVLYSIFRFFIEYMRGGYQFWGVLTAGQITSLGLIIISVISYRYLLRNYLEEEEY